MQEYAGGCGFEPFVNHWCHFVVRGWPSSSRLVCSPKPSRYCTPKTHAAKFESYQSFETYPPERCSGRSPLVLAETPPEVPASGVIYPAVRQKSHLSNCLRGVYAFNPQRSWLDRLLAPAIQTRCSTHHSKHVAHGCFSANMHMVLAGRKYAWLLLLRAHVSDTKMIRAETDFAAVHSGTQTLIHLAV